MREVESNLEELMLAEVGDYFQEDAPVFFLFPIPTCHWRVFVPVRKCAVRSQNPSLWKL